MPNKHNSMVFYSSTLEIPCVQKNWSSVPLIAFFGKKDQQRRKAMPKNNFLRHLYNGGYTQLTCTSEACQA